MPEPDAAPGLSQASEAEIVSVVQVPAGTSLATPQDVTGKLWQEVELDRLRRQHELVLERLRQEGDEKKHRHKRELIDRVAGHVLRGIVIAGGIALFPLHFPAVGGVLLGAGLGLLTKSELRNMLRGAIQGYRGK